MSNFRAVVRAARLANEEVKRSKAARRDLIRRIAALKPEHLFEGMVRAFLNVEAAVEYSEHYARDARWERLSTELRRRIAKGHVLAKCDEIHGLTYAQNSERISEIFDEMAMLDPIDPESPRVPLSHKYKRQAELKARLAERNGARL
jgi:hypothetical protein